MTSRPSSRRERGRSLAIPKGSRLSASPEPTPRTKRPPVRWSRVSAVWAREAGWRRMTSVTPMPSRMSRVAAAAAATTGTGSNQMWGLGWVAAPAARGRASRSTAGTSAAGGRPTRWRRTPAARAAGPPPAPRRRAGAPRPSPTAPDRGAPWRATYSAAVGPPTPAGGGPGVLMVAAPELRARVDGDLGDDRPAVAGPSRRARQVHDQGGAPHPGLGARQHRVGRGGERPGADRLGDARDHPLAGRARGLGGAVARAQPRAARREHQVRGPGGVADRLQQRRQAVAVIGDDLALHHLRPGLLDRAGQPGPRAVLALAAGGAVRHRDDGHAEGHRLRRGPAAAESGRDRGAVIGARPWSSRRGAGRRSSMPGSMPFTRS